MDHSHDPFHPTSSYLPPSNGPQATSAQGFRESRWRQAGATDEQIDSLRAEHEDRTLDDQLQHNSWLDSHSDPELAESLTGKQAQQVQDTDITHTEEGPNEPADPPSPVQAPVDEYSGNVSDILSKVGSSAEKAQAALDVEQARDKPRVSLVNELTKIIG